MDEKINFEPPITYAVKIKNTEVRLNSRSGGIFTAISDYVLEQNGKVYGCIMDNNKAIHIGTDNKEVRDKMRGSKYIQSEIGNVYSLVKQDLEEGKLVLFTGTPCQINGLDGFLKKIYENLICIDIICHGVPSPKVWKEYVKWQEEKNKSKCKKMIFRNKIDFGWDSHIETLIFENGKKINSRVFTNIFYSHNTLRPSCYSCPFKSVHRISDITIGDYWGIDKIDSSFNDNKGVSLVIVNNKKGLEIFEKIEKSIDYIKTDIYHSLQKDLLETFKKPYEREKFWKTYYNNGFEKVARTYGKYGVVWKIRKLIFRLERKVNKIFKINE